MSYVQYPMPIVTQPPGGYQVDFISPSLSVALPIIKQPHPAGAVNGSTICISR
jgi:hypothetical protein